VMPGFQGPNSPAVAAAACACMERESRRLGTGSARAILRRCRPVVGGRAARAPRVQLDVVILTPAKRLDITRECATFGAAARCAAGS
jgi:hypothetical protein